MWTFLLANQNLPFAVALGVVLAIGVIEILGMIVGAGLGHALDSFIDMDLAVDVDMDGIAPDSHFNVLAWLGFGLAPGIVVLLLLFANFGILGYAIQVAAQQTTGSLLSPWIASIAALALTLPASRKLAQLAGRHVFKDESLAVSEDSFLGKPAIITLGTAETGRPTQARLIDRHGQDHYVLVEPSHPEDRFSTGAEVLLIERVGTIYRVIANTTDALVAMSERLSAPVGEDIHGTH